MKLRRIPRDLLRRSMMLSRPRLVFETVRHLRPVQFYARLAKRLARVRPDPSPAPPLREAAGTWVEPAPRPASLAADWRVCFLNEEGRISHPGQWNDPAKLKLWLYNLHYFDDLCAADGAERRQLQRSLVTRWIVENPPPAGNGWEPYPTSLRIVNWIKWHLTGQALDRQMHDSLAMQARWLMAHVEWHLLGNHILANAKALVFAGLFFSGGEAKRWLGAGLTIFARELPEQVLADGAHFELSPMYHAIILEDVLDLLNIARLYGIERRSPMEGLAGLAERMRRWLAAMTHPDGGPAFFNDAAFGIAASRAELEAYAARLALAPLAELGEGVHHFAASGYIRVNRGDMAAILDVAAVGPDYIPGHAHADTLSFELSKWGERVIVNGGTSTYAPGPERERQRSTAAHSTVEIDGESSSEVWASFRVARRARISALSIEEHDGVVTVRATHNGYRRLLGSNLHTRTWRFEEKRLRVLDGVTGFCETACARFLLGPGSILTLDESGISGRVVTAHAGTIEWRSDTVPSVVPATWHPEFGGAVPTVCVTVPIVSGASRVSIEW